MRAPRALPGGRLDAQADNPIPTRALTARGESRSNSPNCIGEGIDRDAYTVTHGHGHPRPRTTSVVDCPPLWIAASDLPASPGHPFYTRLNALLDADGFDAFVEDACRSFYAPVWGRPSLAPGRYFRLLLIGYFEGIDSERGIAWRAADSLAVRHFLRLGLDAPAPDHSTMSRTRRLIDVETHRAVFTWVQQRLVAAGLLKGRTVAIDATTLEANAAMRSIVRRDTGEAYQAYLTRLAAAAGINTPTREVRARFDRKRKKRTSNKDWRSPSDPDAKVAKMKAGRTHVAHKAEHAIDLESGALVAVTLQDADQGDTPTIVDTAIAAAEQVEAAHAAPRHRGKPARDRRRQGVPQQRDDGGSCRGGPAVVHLGTAPRPARLVRRARRPSARLWESPPAAGGSRATLAAAPGRTRRAIVCAPL